MKNKIAVLICLVLGACTGTPQGITPVSNFDVTRYLGTWYEIARLDHRFERGLDNVSATYSQNDNGSISVLNKGYSEDDGQWDSAQGTAKFVGPEDISHLKVSFFGPFYGSYVIFDLDRDRYDHAYVSGLDRSYLWYLSRSPTVSQDEKQRFITTAKELGFNTDDLIFVDQDRNISDE